MTKNISTSHGCVSFLAPGFPLQRSSDIQHSALKMVWRGKGKGMLGAPTKILTRICNTNSNPRKVLSVSAATQKALLSSTSAAFAPHQTFRMSRQHYISSSSSHCSCSICYRTNVIKRTARPTTVPPWTRAFCARSSEQSSAENVPLDVHVTHVDARQRVATEAAGEEGGIGAHRAAVEDRSTEEEARLNSDTPVEVRFLDVPGSEETRAEKMTIVFTCTVCETRSAKTFAKLSYEKGVVLARCPGCHNLHLIADRLGWFEDKTDGGWDLEKLQDRIGEANCQIVTNDNIMELNLVDIVGKNTEPQAEAPESARGNEPEGSGGADAPTHPSSGGSRGNGTL